MALHARLFPLLVLLHACIAASASASDRPAQAAVHHHRSATTSTGNSYGQCAVTMAEYGDGCAATRSVSHHSLGQGATEAEDALLLASSKANSRVAEAKDALPLCRSFTRGPTPSATSGYKPAAEEAIDSVIVSSAAEGKEASSAWSGDKTASSTWSGDKAVDVSATAAVGSTFSRVVEVKEASSAWAGDKPAATAAVGFSCAEEGKEAESGSSAPLPAGRGTTPLTSVEEAAAAAEETAAAAHPSTQMGTSAWGTASPTTPRSPGGKDTLRPSLLAPIQLRISAGTSPLKSLEEMAMC
nr:probable endo-1,3(4)-beta-glucanase An02g00850 [Setaria viridis]